MAAEERKLAKVFEKVYGYDLTPNRRKIFARQ